mgnify:CR=1 FL=1
MDRQKLLNLKTKMEKEKSSGKNPKFSDDLYKKLKSFIDKQENEFLLRDLKMSLFKRTDYGGRKFLQKLLQVFKLRKKKEKGKIILSKK